MFKIFFDKKKLRKTLDHHNRCGILLGIHFWQLEASDNTGIAACGRTVSGCLHPPPRRTHLMQEEREMKGTGGGLVIAKDA